MKYAIYRLERERMDGWDEVGLDLRAREFNKG